MITSLMNFRDLTGEAVIQARQSVINAEIEAAREKVIHARSLFEAGIHNVVNSSSGIKAAAAHFLVIKRLQTDTRYLDAVITDNLCMFSPEGYLYLFMQQRYFR
ncbi:Uncharacterised protein [Escherichia coli]|uniref:hypothetical protein n=1 Tax=Escherichia coli TaxID=562 RepID=UPI001917AD15|nr:hypothetical protein [Escherichia coli]EGY9847485.1 hypothetical protein [Escherichia coli]CAD6158861.1 Uncharacterised protein [Escherichia coli]